MFSNTSTAHNVPTRMRKLATLVTAAAAFTGASFPAFADNDHWDRFSCYAQVHDNCFPNGQNECGDDVYQDFLDDCDDAYPSAGRVGGLVTPGGSPHRNMTTRR
jgi:hypothetical protein